MPRSLSSILPARFAQDCASNAFVLSCEKALTALASAETLTAGAATLAGLAGGPFAFVGLYAGASLLRWKRDQRAAAEVKGELRTLAETVRGLGDADRDRAELDALLGELLERNSEMRERLEQAERAIRSTPPSRRVPRSSVCCARWTIRSGNA